MVITIDVESQARDMMENRKRMKQERERQCKPTVKRALHTIGSAFRTAWAAYLALGM